jgi:tripeptide aminopeptidase
MQEELIERFVRYAKIDTQSKNALKGQQCPTNPNELVLAKMLVDELKALGVNDIYSNNDGFVIARLKGSKGNLPSIAFMAHLDTAEGVPASNVQPQICYNYDGKKIILNEGTIIDPSTDRHLGGYVGDTIITANGTTLLGADDKAGIAAIMTAVSYLKQNKTIEHGDIELVFTPDEEGGDGMSHFPLTELKSKIAYTLDGDELGGIEKECFTSYGVDIECTGVALHPGFARAIAGSAMVNATLMAVAFVNLIPQSESPEATDGYYGYYLVKKFEGGLQSAQITVNVNDFDNNQCLRRIEALKSFAAAVEAAFPGGKVSIKTRERSLNMREGIEKNPAVMNRLLSAMKAIGLASRIEPIRGGTDGARLTAMGIPCPNIFTGGHNFHSKHEWLSVGSLEKACQLIIAMAQG